MSLHAELNPEALDKLRIQRRMTTISSLVIAVLMVVLIATVLGFFLLPTLVRESPTIVTYESNVAPDTTLEQKKVTTSMERKPTAPAASMVKVIAANTASPTAIPVPEVEIGIETLDFGAGEDFGSDWGEGAEAGSGAGGGMFGATSGPGLVGTFYDLKQTPEGKPTEMGIQDFEKGGKFDVNAPVNKKYDEHLNRAIRRNLDGSALADFFRARNQLRLTQLYVPRIKAEMAPKEFEVESQVKGRRWVISYHGTVTPPESGRFRFVGFSDDVLVVLADNRVVLDGSLASPLRGADRRKSFHQTHTVKGWKTYIGRTLTVRDGVPIDLKILIGERPGGHFSGYLLIEKIGVDYREDSNGSPILPLFKMKPSGMPERGASLPDLAPDTAWSVWRGQS